MAQHEVQRSPKKHTKTPGADDEEEEEEEEAAAGWPSPVEWRAPGPAGTQGGRSEFGRRYVQQEGERGDLRTPSSHLSQSAGVRSATPAPQREGDGADPHGERSGSFRQRAGEREAGREWRERVGNPARALLS